MHRVPRGGDGQTIAHGDGPAAAAETGPSCALGRVRCPVEMLARIRGDPVIAATGFILLTARAQKIDEPDVDGFVAKPFSLVELMQCVDAVLARRA